MTKPDDPFARFPLAASLSEDQRTLLREAGGERRLSAGATLFREGEAAEALFGVLRGRMKLVRTSPAGKELLLHLVGPGETFAEAALFAGETYPAAAVAVEDSTLFVLERARLLGLLERSPALALGMLASLSRWTRRLAHRLGEMTQRRVEERLASYLLAHASDRTVSTGDVIALREPRHLIAAQIGTAPEVLSRALRRLEDEGVARFDAREVRLLDPVRLRELAGRSL